MTLPGTPDPDDRRTPNPRDRRTPDPGDLRLAARVARELLADARIRDEPIRIAVQNRVVILTGVAGAHVRDAAGAVARGSEGVRDVCNLIRPPDGTPSDFDEIVAGLRSAPRPYPLRVFALVSFVLIVAWTLLLIAVFRLGWTAAVLACAVLLIPPAAHLLTRRLNRRR
ncbi:BON domain-containing protein [Catenuloplanes japonicus]|uniref:BON domain-containing protein n=1 Tax=Catenuloplanes japonicus TaxID=33876 RepID=UPI000691EB69|nr:BON domain-containing protein [Catenuloplanes japonicus]